MKQQIIELKKKLLLVELPEGIAKNNYPNELLLYWDDRGYLHSHLLDINVELIGKLTDITESQFAGLVGSKESFFSKLEADGIYFENPYGETPVNIKKREYKSFPGGKKAAQEFNEMEEQEWQEAESKVWNKGRCYLFEII